MIGQDGQIPTVFFVFCFFHFLLLGGKSIPGSFGCVWSAAWRQPPAGWLHSSVLPRCWGRTQKWSSLWCRSGPARSSHPGPVADSCSCQTNRGQMYFQLSGSAHQRIRAEASCWAQTAAVEYPEVMLHVIHMHVLLFQHIWLIITLPFMHFTFIFSSTISIS